MRMPPVQILSLAALSFLGTAAFAQTPVPAKKVESSPVSQQPAVPAAAAASASKPDTQPAAVPPASPAPAVVEAPSPEDPAPQESSLGGRINTRDFARAAWFGGIPDQSAAEEVLRHEKLLKRARKGIDIQSLMAASDRVQVAPEDDDKRGDSVSNAMKSLRKGDVPGLESLDPRDESLAELEEFYGDAESGNGESKDDEGSQSGSDEVLQGLRPPTLANILMPEASVGGGPLGPSVEGMLRMSGQGGASTAASLVESRGQANPFVDGARQNRGVTVGADGGLTARQGNPFLAAPSPSLSTPQGAALKPASPVVRPVVAPPPPPPAPARPEARERRTNPSVPQIRGKF